MFKKLSRSSDLRVLCLERGQNIIPGLRNRGRDRGEPLVQIFVLRLDAQEGILRVWRRHELDVKQKNRSAMMNLGECKQMYLIALVD